MDTTSNPAVAPTALPDDLTAGEMAIIKRLRKKPIELYWGRNGWIPDGLPKPARRADFDRIIKRDENIVQISIAQLQITEEYATPDGEA